MTTIKELIAKYGTNNIPQKDLEAAGYTRITRPDGTMALQVINAKPRAALVDKKANYPGYPGPKTREKKALGVTRDIESGASLEEICLSSNVTPFNVFQYERRGLLTLPQRLRQPYRLVEIDVLIEEGLSLIEMYRRLKLKGWAFSEPKIADYMHITSQYDYWKRASGAQRTEGVPQQSELSIQNLPRTADQFFARVTPFEVEGAEYYNAEQVANTMGWSVGAVERLLYKNYFDELGIQTSQINGQRVFSTLAIRQLYDVLAKGKAMYKVTPSRKN